MDANDWGSTTCLFVQPLKKSLPIQWTKLHQPSPPPALMTMWSPPPTSSMMWPPPPAIDDTITTTSNIDNPHPCPYPQCHLMMTPTLTIMPAPPAQHWRSPPMPYEYIIYIVICVVLVVHSSNEFLYITLLIQCCDWEQLAGPAWCRVGQIGTQWSGWSKIVQESNLRWNYPYPSDILSAVIQSKQAPPFTTHLPSPHFYSSQQPSKYFTNYFMWYMALISCLISSCWLAMHSVCCLPSAS